jgi:ATP-dependent helicase/nuclease subunit A
MNLEIKKASPEALRQQTERDQGQASDPVASAWVNANAGTGKTHVLTLRVLRLLLSRTSPERILCLTYTKAAAAEMSRRVFEQLSGWVTADDAKLKSELASITGEPVVDDTVAFARTLFARAIETPGGLKVQTIHAFAERLLQRFPLEAGVPPDFKILDDAASKELKAKAIEKTLIEATGAPGSPLGKALDIVVRYAADAQFDKLMSNAVEERRWLDAKQRRDLDTFSDDFEAIDAHLRRTLGVRAALVAADVHDECGRLLSDSELRDIHGHLSGGGKTDVKHAAIVTAAREHLITVRRFESLSTYFLVDDGDGMRASLMSKALSEARPDLLSRCQQAQQRFFELSRELRALALIEASVALYRLAGSALRHYQDARNSAGVLDFDDLMLKTRSLLEGQSGEAQWVLYKLDDGLDHILVDEAQDTSPEQWQIIRDLAQDFFANSESRTGLPRTIFAVGDEKQSIYSFQGADPKMFAEAGEHFAKLAREARLSWRPVSLTMSFRTVAPVLTGVDRVFADAERTPGLTAGGPAIRHAAMRLGHAGLVEIWPTEKSDQAPDADPWSPLADSNEASPANRLAERIADTIERWIKSGERLLSEDRAIRAGDILILVRKRNPFAVPMIAALKRRGIQVAGSDRVALTDQIAVQDLMVLGDFLTLPEDDLALATVLKSPIFGFDDDHLLAIASGRKKTLWSALIDNADAVPLFKTAAETLRRWRAKADFAPPFEFFSSVLDRDGVRETMLNRLGPEAADTLDEFLDFALRYDDGAPPSLTEFLAGLRAAEPEIKRDMEHGRDEVRVMTVHGAKGLEAPIVFLPDTCTTASGDNSSASVTTLGQVDGAAGTPEPLVWSVKGTSKVPAIVAARAEKEAREREERNRLLYVAMTRARDRLYVAGFEGKKGRVDGCWYNLIVEALTPILTEIDLGNGRQGLRLEAPQTAEPKKSDEKKRRSYAGVERPEFATRRAPPEPKLSVPLAPSRLEAYAPNAEGEPLTPPPRRDTAASNDAPSPLSSGGETRFLRGTLTHALLQHLPGVPDAERARLAKAFVEKRGAQLSPKVRAGIVDETLAIINHPDFAALFGPGSMAEVPIAAIIPRPDGKGPALDLSGQIDRLAVTNEDVLIVDYKTNRPPPSEVRYVAHAYLYQLAAYRVALNEIYPGRRVRAALLWTDGPRLMEIQPNVLDEFEKRLWDLDVQSLDAP